jgi:hypothetical protein
MINVEIFPVLWYLDETSSHYHFKLRFICHPVLAWWLPATEIKDAILEVVERLISSAWDVSSFVPRFYPAGSTFPIDGSLLDSYSLPTDAYFDYLELIPWVDLDSYASFSIFQGVLPLFLKDGDCYYSKDTEDLSEVPSSLPGCLKLPPDVYGGTVFTPEKANYSKGYPVVARRYQSGYYYTEFFLEWLFLYEGKSEEHPHILFDWTDYDPSNQKLYVPDDSIDIFPDYSIPFWEGTPLKKDGWNIWKDNYPTWWEIFVEGYRSPTYKWRYYPDRDSSGPPDGTIADSDTLPFLPDCFDEDSDENPFRFLLVSPGAKPEKTDIPILMNESPISIGGFPVLMPLFE